MRVTALTEFTTILRKFQIEIKTSALRQNVGVES